MAGLGIAALAWLLNCFRKRFVVVRLQSSKVNMRAVTLAKIISTSMPNPHSIIHKATNAAVALRKNHLWAFTNLVKRDFVAVKRARARFSAFGFVLRGVGVFDVRSGLCFMVSQPMFP